MKNCGELGISKAIGESALFCRYTCSTCGHDTQWRKVDTVKFFLDLKERLLPVLSAQRFANDAEETEVYYKSAKAELQKLFSRIIRQVNEGQYDALTAREKECPACGAKQPWMLKPAKRPAEFAKPQLWHDPVVDGEFMLSDFVDPACQEKLDAPCSIEIMRLSSFLGAMDSVNIMLNGQHIGDLRIGTSITVQSSLRHNILALHSVPGGPALSAVAFDGEAGGHILKRFAGAKFK